MSGVFRRKTLLRGSKKEHMNILQFARIISPVRRALVAFIRTEVIDIRKLRDTGFLIDLPLSRLPRRFARIYVTFWESPELRVAVLHERDLPFCIHHNASRTFGLHHPAHHSIRISRLCSFIEPIVMGQYTAWACVNASSIIGLEIGLDREEVVKILLAAPNAALGRMLQTKLNDRGLAVELVERACAAISRAAQGDHDALIIDTAEFPDRSGIDVVRRVQEMERQRIKQRPIFAITGDDAAKEAARRHCSGLLPNPVEPDGIIRVIELFVDNPAKKGARKPRPIEKWRGREAA